VSREGASLLDVIKSSFTDIETLSTSILIVNVFSWYFPLYIFLRNSLKALAMTYEELLMIFGLHYVAVLLSAIIGIMILRKFTSRNTLLSIWMLLGTLFSFSMVFLEIGNLPIIYLVFFLIGIALGFGYPCCLAYFADSINIESKGKTGGIMLFTAFIGTFLIGFLTNILIFWESVLIYTLWRAMGFIAFQMVKGKKSKIEEKNVETSYTRIFSEKAFTLYMIPWTMFCIVNFFVGPLQEYHWSMDIFSEVLLIEVGIASVATLIGGYFADAIGRKRVVISGYILLGIGYAVLSISPMNTISIGVYSIFDGIAWGLFSLIFLVVMWGDLAGNKASERYYLLGALPFLISSYLWVMVAPFAEVIPISASFSLASFFLFVAVIPLMYAPETLPEKTIRDRELEQYVEQAKKAKEKYT
jgi:MFS family permease